MKDWVSWYFEILNRWKKSINLDLKNTKDLDKFYDLIKEADIFVENFSSDTKNRLKIDYSTLKKINPKIIYGSLNWYWENLNKKSYDVIIQAESWLASLNWEKKYMKNATAIVDTFSWLSLSLAITSLLYNRKITWRWGFVNIPMIAWAIQMTEQNIIETSLSWKNPGLVWNWDNAIFPFGFFKTLDWDISIAIWNDSLWEIFISNMIPEINWKFLDNNSRLENKGELKNIIENKFSKYSTKSLSIILDKIWIPNSRINSIKDVLDNEFYKKEKYIKEINHPKLWKCFVPYEFIKYNDFEIEKIKFSPDLEK